MNLLEIKGLTTRLASEAGWVHALDDLSLCIGKGQTYALVGESGCGKSMTALSIARLLPDSGAILAGTVRLESPQGSEPACDLMQISEAAMRKFRGRRVAMIFQEPGTSLNPVMTVGDQLAEVICLHSDCSESQAREQAVYWLEKVGLPDPTERLDQFPFEMSGGQKQRVMIAMALAVKPDLLIADEPTTALDVSIQKQVMDLLVRLQKEEGMAMLLITHDLGIVQNVADYVGLMYAGQLVESATAADFFRHPRHPYAKALIRSLPTKAQRGRPLYTLEGRVPVLVGLEPGCRFAGRCEFVQDQCREADIAWLDTEVGGHSVRCIRFSSLEKSKLTSGIATESPPSDSAAVSHGPIMQTVGLSVAYRYKAGFLGHAYKQVLHGLDLTLVKGKTVALVGESGSGKTTAARALLDLLGGSARVQGQILLNGRPIQNWDAMGRKGWRAQVQFVFQDPFASLNPRHRIQQILEESLINLRPDMDQVQRSVRLTQVCEQVQLPEAALSRYPHEFSGGQRQRIAIARALVSEPKVLICDEPTSALDVSVQAQILNLLGRLQQQTGVAMLLITHNLAVVQYLADEVVVLKDGIVVERAGAEHLFSKPRHEYTRQLLEAAPLFHEGQ